MFSEKQKNCIKRIHLVSDNGLSNLKAYYRVEIVFMISNNFISSLDNVEKRVISSKSDNIEIMINYEEDEVIKELFDSLKNRYQLNWNR